MQRQMTTAMVAYGLWEYSFIGLTPPASANESSPYNLGNRTTRITNTDMPLFADGANFGTRYFPGPSGYIGKGPTSGYPRYDSELDTALRGDGCGSRFGLAGSAFDMYRYTYKSVPMGVFQWVPSTGQGKPTPLALKGIAVSKAGVETEPAARRVFPSPVASLLHLSSIAKDHLVPDDDLLFFQGFERNITVRCSLQWLDRTGLGFVFVLLRRPGVLIVPPLLL